MIFYVCTKCNYSNRELFIIEADDGGILSAVTLFGVSTDFTYISEGKKTTRMLPSKNYIVMAMNFDIKRENDKWIIYGFESKNKLPKKSNIVVKESHDSHLSPPILFNLYESVRQRRLE